MLLGTLMFDVAIQAKNSEDQQRISSAIIAAVKAIDGVNGCEEVDSDVEEAESE